MENQGRAENSRDDSELPAAQLSAFKLPPGYGKFKKKIAKSSEYAKLGGFLNKIVSSGNLVFFCRDLLKHKDFSSFKTAHLFKHEKGQSFARKYEIDPRGESVSDFHVNEFNKLFQAIKKSKNRAYGQEALRGFNFGIVGTFLAREFSLENHNVIFAVSRNDFLSQTKSEKQAFAKVTKVIAPYFNIILDKELETQHTKHLQLAYQYLPCKVIHSDQIRDGYKPLPSGAFYKVEMEGTLNKADVFHQERVSLLGELLNTLKHELSNPLFGLQLSAQILTQEFEDLEHTQFMEEIASSIKRSQSIISNFTELYTSSERLNASDLEKTVKEIFTLTKSQSRHIHKEYVADGPKDPDFLVEANSVWLAQILFNLVINSAQALNQAGAKNPSIKVKSVLSKPFELHVCDNGPGVDPATLENMFKPFYTTKEKGTGLGLAISQSLARKLGGAIEYRGGGQGAHFILRLPS